MGIMKHITAAAVAIVSAVSGSAAMAACDWTPERVSVLLGSNHLGNDEDLNEVNPGVFLSWDCGPTQITAGAYENSYSNTYVALTVAYPVFSSAWLEVSPFIGIVDYADAAPLQGVHYGDLVPLVGLQLRSGNLFVQVLPGDQKNVTAVVAAGLTFDLGE